jgi:hypothetical protein
MSRPDILTQIAAAVEKKLVIRQTGLSKEKLLGMMRSARKPKAFTGKLRGGIKVPLNPTRVFNLRSKTQYKSLAVIFRAAHLRFRSSPKKIILTEA